MKMILASKKTRFMRKKDLNFLLVMTRGTHNELFIFNSVIYPFSSSSLSFHRFQQQNQTQRCFVMYTDFYRCQHILGEDSEACTWFKDVFTSICPRAWVERWDELRLTGRLPWHKYRTQGPFPGNKYGE